MKTLALFDFDETLYRKDSLLEFTKFSKGAFSFYFGIVLLSPILIGLKLKMIKNDTAKKRFITYFFCSKNHEQFCNQANAFALSKIEENLNPEIYTFFKNHILKGDVIYIVTASFPEWIFPWSNQYGVKVIGTKLEIKNNRLTGNFSTKNCYGIEKVNRIKAEINIDLFDKIVVYGSGTGDKEMLQLKRA